MDREQVPIATTTQNDSRLIRGLRGFVYGGMVAAVITVGIGLVFAAVRGEQPFRRLTYFTPATSMETVRDRALPITVPIGAIAGLIFVERRRN